MNGRLLELALRKQRLQMLSAQQRDAMAADAVAFEPLFEAADRARDAGTWLRRHPEIAVGAVVALLVARPRALLRWSHRGVLVWQGVRRVRQWLDQRPTR